MLHLYATFAPLARLALVLLALPLVGALFALAFAVLPVVLPVVTVVCLVAVLRRNLHLIG